MLYNGYRNKERGNFYEANYDTNCCSCSTTKIIYADTPWKLDKEVNDFIDSITEKGFKVISISINTNRQEYYHYTTTIIYGIYIES